MKLNNLFVILLLFVTFLFINSLSYSAENDLLEFEKHQKPTSEIDDLHNPIYLKETGKYHFYKNYDRDFDKLSNPIPKWKAEKLNEYYRASFYNGKVRTIECYVKGSLYNYSTFGYSTDSFTDKGLRMKKDPIIDETPTDTTATRKRIVRDYVYYEPYEELVKAIKKRREDYTGDHKYLGYLIDTAIYSGDNGFSYRIVRGYAPIKSKKTKSYTYVPNGIWQYYDANNHLTLKARFDKGKMKWYSIYKYDKATGYLTEEERYGANKKLKFYYLFRYGTKGERVAKEMYDENGELQYYWRYLEEKDLVRRPRIAKFDKNGKVVSEGKDDK